MSTITGSVTLTFYHLTPSGNTTTQPKYCFRSLTTPCIVGVVIWHFV